MKKIYISGAITNNPNYKEQFAAAEAKLTAKGYSVINPAKNTGNTYKEYIDKGMEQLMHCDAIYMLPGYSHSTGATLELTYAFAIGINILFAEGAEEMKNNNKNEFVAAATVNKTNTIEITIEEYSRLKDIETRFAILKGSMIHADFCPIHHQIILGIEKEYAQKTKEINADLFPLKK